MIRRLLTVGTLGALLFVLSGCGDSGIVQDRRSERNAIGAWVRQLCLGDTKDTCVWTQLRGKSDLATYRACEVGEQYPACARWEGAGEFVKPTKEAG